MRKLLTIFFSILCVTALAQSDPHYNSIGLKPIDTVANTPVIPIKVGDMHLRNNKFSGKLQYSFNGVTWFNVGSGTTSTVIPNGSVTYSKIQNVTGLSLFGRAANSTGVGGEITAASDFQVMRRSGSSLGFGSINLASTNAVTGLLGAANGGLGIGIGSALNALRVNSGGTAYEFYNPLLSPVFTGDPKAPTPAGGDNDTSIPNTGWVQTEISNYQSLAAINSYSADRTLTITDVNKSNGAGVIRVPPGAGTGIDFTIPTNSSVAYDVPTIINFDNQSSNPITIKFAGGVTGNETVVPANTFANVVKVATNTWDTAVGSSGGGGISSCPAQYTEVVANHALVVGDFATCNGEGTMTFTGTGPYTLTVNTNATSAIPDDYVLGIINETSANITVAFAVGVTHVELSLIIPPLSAGFLKKYDTDGWYLLGTGIPLINSAQNNEITKSDGVNLVSTGIFTTGGTTTFGPSSSIIQGAQGISGNPNGYPFTILGGQAYGTGNNNGGPLVLGGGANNGSGAVGFVEHVGAQNFATTTITASTTIGSHYTVLTNSAASVITVTLPTAASAFVSNTGRVYVIKKIDNVANTVVDAAGSELIDGATTRTLTGQYDFIMIQSNGSAWFIISQNIAFIGWFIWRRRRRDSTVYEIFKDAA